MSFHTLFFFFTFTNNLAKQVMCNYYIFLPHKIFSMLVLHICNIMLHHWQYWVSFIHTTANHKFASEVIYNLYNISHPLSSDPEFRWGEKELRVHTSRMDCCVINTVDRRSRSKTEMVKQNDIHMYNRIIVSKC